MASGRERSAGENTVVSRDQNDGNEGPATAKSPKKIGAGAVASFVGVAALLIFILQNRQNVNLDFLFWTFSWPLWALTAVSAVLGSLVWEGVGVVRRYRRRSERRAARREKH